VKNRKELETSGALAKNRNTLNKVGLLKELKQLSNQGYQINGS
jgi:hypothetical protein